MVDLSVNFAGLELKNPLAIASADHVRNIAQVMKAEECGASAVILKGMLPDGSSELSSTLRVFVDEKAQTVYGAAGASRLSYTAGVELVKEAKRNTNIKIGVNLPFLAPEDPDIIADAARRLVKAGADFVEVNFKPQTVTYLNILEGVVRDKTDAGDKAGKIAEYLREAIRQVSEGTHVVKESVSVPVIAKLVPEGIDVLPLAMAAQKAGADALDAIGSLSGTFKIDVHDGGKTKIPCARTAAFLLNGAMLKPYSQAAVARISRALDIPVMGTGGLMNWTETVEMIMFGATTVSFCGLLMIHGFEALVGIEKKLKAYMEQQGYSRIEDFRSAALKYVVSSMASSEIIPAVARIDKEKCNGCGKCLKPAHCVSISLADGKATVDEATCLGCATCFLICPQQAASMVEI